jgi:glutamate 5-kinase
MKVVPIVNENDTVATAEIRYGDNDRLSARVASMCSADQLIIFSDVDGLYTKSPNHNDSRHVPLVEKIDETIEAMASGSGSHYGTGGMITKIEAAKIATQAGTQVIIASGIPINPVSRLQNSSRKTVFTALDSPVSARRQWIASDLSPAGCVVIDSGAADAIQNNRSLLPVGVLSIMGEFSRGDILEIKNRSGEPLGRGISAYDRSDAEKLLGQRTDDIESVLAYRGPENLIHRDDMIVFPTSPKQT